jgi:hypothetical protein
LAESPETYHSAGLRRGTATSFPTKIGTRSTDVAPGHELDQNVFRAQECVPLRGK